MFSDAEKRGWTREKMKGDRVPELNGLVRKRMNQAARDRNDEVGAGCSCFPAEADHV